MFPSGRLPLAAVVVGLTLYNGSVNAEILRAGILSLPQGQREAASSSGLRRGQTMRMIELPQAVTAILPALVSQKVIALKESALGYQIGFIELIRSGRQSVSHYRNFFAALIVVGVIMVAISFALTTFAMARAAPALPRLGFRSPAGRHRGRRGHVRRGPRGGRLPGGSWGRAPAGLTPPPARAVQSPSAARSSAAARHSSITTP
ncbi:hypothetical protein GCM10023353_22360 [Tomitella cavernea]|uniref:ABC transmembrane type-1 domain-containing protein n=1 Tax=Tomitella cavernea TaxID=1387982 RepID=A0ABP9CPR5_9ACTN